MFRDGGLSVRQVVFRARIRKFARRASSLVWVAALAAAPLSGFDTLWHLRCTQHAGEQYGFSEHAWKIMQLGNFSADFFGPIAEYAAKNMTGGEVDALKQLQANSPRSKGAALFLHFDNLNGDLKSNSQFDYLISHLLENTQAALAAYWQLRIDERTRKALILVTLGASLHAVQDFYSHSDWIHNDFDQTAVKSIKLPSGGVRAPTWFEFREKAGSPDKWPFRVQSGIYPPIPGAANTHTHMNHDNSRLLYIETETPGQPLVSQAEHHRAGLNPALGDESSNLAHQQLAVNTAAAAGIEWIAKVQENPEARKAIESAKQWDLRVKDSRLVKELEAGMDTEITLSCLSGKWDGDNPQGSQGLICRSLLDRRATSLGGSSSQLQSEIIGLAANLLLPLALKYTGMFWDIHGQYQVLERLTTNLGAGNGRYQLDQK